MKISQLSLALLFVSSITYAEFDCPDGTNKLGAEPPRSDQVKCINADGKQHGPFWMWYGNGQMMQSLNYKNGKEHGKQQAWFPNGKVMMDGISVEGIRYEGFKYFNYHGEPVELEFINTEKGKSNK